MIDGFDFQAPIPNDVMQFLDRREGEIDQHKYRDVVIPKIYFLSESDRRRTSATRARNVMRIEDAIDEQDH